MISGMKAASHLFYSMAQATGNHAFIEFTGLMNEYIKLCVKSVEQGKDFTCANTHVGQSLPFELYPLGYLLEKIECIYGPWIAALIKVRYMGQHALPDSMYDRAG